MARFHFECSECGEEYAEDPNRFVCSSCAEMQEPGGTIRGVRSKLGYLSRLGVTTLWITPVVEQIEHPVER